MSGYLELRVRGFGFEGFGFGSFRVLCYEFRGSGLGFKLRGSDRKNCV